MNILFGFPQFYEWKFHLLKLPYNIHFYNFSNINRLINYIDQTKINIIIPLTYPQMNFVARHYDQLISRVDRIICDKDNNTIQLLDNKQEFYKLFSKYVSLVYILQTDQVKQVIHPPQFPCIFKLAKSFGGDGSFIIHNQKEIDKINNTKNYVIQAYIRSPYEYSGHFYVKDGMIKFMVFYMMTNHEPTYIQHGRLLKYDRIIEAPWTNTFVEIFKQLNYTGFACIDFKVIDNNPIIFEINPRLGGSIVCTNEDDMKRIIEIVLK